MPISSSDLKRPGHQFALENSHGKVMVRVNNEALIALGATPEEESLSATLVRHMRRLRAVAMQLAGSGRCSVLASSQGARIQTSHSSSVSRMTGMAFGWIGSTMAFGDVVRKP